MPAPAREAPELARGDRVRLVGLRSQPDLNGFAGTLVTFKDNRWIVNLDGQKGHKLIKPKHVQKLQEAEEVPIAESPKASSSSAPTPRSPGGEPPEQPQPSLTDVEAAMRRGSVLASEGGAALREAFEGRWEDEEGTLITIQGSKICGPDGTVDLEVHSSFRCSFRTRDAVFEGTLTNQGSRIAWSDDNVWIRPHGNKGDAPEALALRLGDRVRLTGLRAEPDLNGRTGSLLSLEDGRWLVSLDGRMGNKSLKPANVRRLRPEEEASAPLEPAVPRAPPTQQVPAAAEAPAAPLEPARQKLLGEHLEEEPSAPLETAVPRAPPTQQVPAAAEAPAAPLEPARQKLLGGHLEEEPSAPLDTAVPRAPTTQQVPAAAEAPAAPLEPARQKLLGEQAAPASPQPEAGAATFACGARVRLRDMGRRRELSGLRGTFVRLQGREAVVRLDGHRDDVLVGCSSLMGLSPPVALPSFHSACIVGSWSRWSAESMHWDEAHRCYHAEFHMGASGQERFQVWLDGSSRLCLHPDSSQAAPFFEYQLCGPDAGGHGKDWTVGQHPLDCSEAGARYCVRLFLAEDGGAELVDWVRLPTRSPAAGGDTSSVLRRQVPAFRPGQVAPVRLPSYSCLTIVGSWDDWKGRYAMAWSANGRFYSYRLQVGRSGWESFHILLDGDHGKCLHPDRADAHPETFHRICEPDDRGHGLDWSVYPGVPLVWFEVRLFMTENGGAEKVDWVRISAAARRVAAQTPGWARLGHFDRLQVAGSWNDWKPQDMGWDTSRSCYFLKLRVREEGRESFHFRLDGSFARRLYPSRMDASPYVEHGLLGPDGAGELLNWVIGAHPRDAGAGGCDYEVRLFLTEDRSQAKAVGWVNVRE